MPTDALLDALVWLESRVLDCFHTHKKSWKNQCYLRMSYPCVQISGEPSWDLGEISSVPS